MSTVHLSQDTRQRIQCLCRQDVALWTNTGIGLSAPERSRLWMRHWREAARLVGRDFAELPLEQVSLLFDSPSERRAFSALGAVGASLSGLSTRYLELAAGHPSPRHELILELQPVRQAVDLELLACWCLAERLHAAGCLTPPDRSLDWPLGLGCSHPFVEGALRGDLVEGHVHLGGVLGTADIWPALLDPRGLQGRLGLLARWQRSLGVRPISRAVKSRMLDLRGLRDLLSLQLQLWRGPTSRTAQPTLKPGLEALRRAVVLEERSLRGRPGGEGSITFLPGRADITPWIASPTRSRLVGLSPALVGRRLIGEREFLVGAFAGALGLFGKAPPWFGPVLLVYVTCRNLFHRTVTQHTRRVGFESFKEWYGSPGRKRIAPLGDELARLQAIHRRVSLDGRVRVEGRVTPVLGRIRAHIEAAQTALDRPAALGRDFGLVIHFVKEPDPRWRAFKQGERALERSTPARHDPVKDPPHLLRHAGLRAKVRAQALDLESWREVDPEISRTTLAIDAASTETDAPPEVFAPAFRYLRRPLYDVPRGGLALQATFHAGESFFHPISGLRAVYEAMEYLDLKRGDRLGHGMVLGIDFEQWLANSELDPYLPMEEKLDDLVWAIHMLGFEGVADCLSCKSSEVKEQLQREFLRTYREGHIPSPDELHRDLVQAWRLRWMDPEELFGVLDALGWSPSSRLARSRRRARNGKRVLRAGEALQSCARHGRCQIREASAARDPGSKPTGDRGQCSASREGDWSRCSAVSNLTMSSRGLAWRLATTDVATLLSGSVSQAALRYLYVHHFDRAFWSCSRQRVDWAGGQGERVGSLDGPARLFDVLRSLVVAEVANRGLTVEVCPTSNQRIGAFGSMDRHPVFLLAGSPAHEGIARPRVMVCTDNPGIFSTNLPNEYALLARAREVDEGERRESPEGVAHWIRRLREESTRASFLRDRSGDVGPPASPITPAPQTWRVDLRWRRFVQDEPGRRARWRLLRRIRADLGGR